MTTVVKESDVQRAAKRFTAFRGREPKKGELLFIRETGTVALVVGELDGLIYRIDGKQRARLHRFRKTERPLLLVSQSGRSAYIVKGRWTFTKRGFEG